MRWCFFIFILTGSVFGQLNYDTIIDRGIYKSYFNQQIKQPIAVVYKLYHGGGNVDRNNKSFKNDPSVLTLKAKDYSYTIYDKGHMANAEDFAFSDSLQELTFRYYNCVPQTHSLNRGKWKSYENKVREFSQKDTIVIICYNYFEKSASNSRHLNVPTICYKAVYDTHGVLLLLIGLTNNTNSEEVDVSQEIRHTLETFAPIFILYPSNH